MSRSGTTKLTPGQHVRFIRYISTADGWTHEVLRGEFEDQTDTAWLVRVVDDVLELPVADWSVYRD